MVRGVLNRVRRRAIGMLLPDDAGRIEHLAPQFADVRRRLERFEDETLTTDYWRDWAAGLAQDFTPPPQDFLQHAVIRHTMFVDAGGPWLQDELRYLAARRSPQELRRLLREDRVGAPSLRSLRYRTSHNRVHHLYHLQRFLDATGADLGEIRTVVEWGGGFGDFARVFGRIERATYVIVDIPVITALQWLYLTAVLGPDNVNLVDREGGSVRPGVINLVPSGLIDVVPPADLFVSTWALSESTPAAEDVVISRDWFGARRLLLAFSGGTLGARADAAGARREPLVVLPDNEYAFR